MLPQADPVIEQPDAAPSLSPAQQVRLAELETRIEKGWSAFLDVAAALKAVKDERLFIAFESFADYCETRRGFGESHGRLLLRAYDVACRLRENDDCPSLPQGARRKNSCDPYVHLSRHCKSLSGVWPIQSVTAHRRAVLSMAWSGPCRTPSTAESKEKMELAAATPASRYVQVRLPDLRKRAFSPPSTSWPALERDSRLTSSSTRLTSRRPERT
jgi:hypothetical protein